MHRRLAQKRWQKRWCRPPPLLNTMVESALNLKVQSAMKALEEVPNCSSAMRMGTEELEEALVQTPQPLNIMGIPHRIRMESTVEALEEVPICRSAIRRSAICPFVMEALQ